MSTTSPAVPSPLRPDRPRILIAEDESLIRLDLCALLAERGWEVCGEARNGREAVRLASDLQPDVALLDLKMPLVDGIEATKQIQAARPTPIVVMTAFDRPSLLARSLIAGATAYVVKPFAEEAIVTTITAAPARLVRERRSSTRTARRAEIGLTAKRLFAAKGYDATSIDDIASEIGLLKGSLYHHIASKEELLVTIVEEFLAASAAVLQHATDTAAGARRRLEVFTMARRALHVLDRSGSTILARCPASIGELRLRSIEKASKADRRFVSDLLVEGRAEGSLGWAGDAADVADMILGLLSAPLPAGTRRLGDDAVDAIARSCADFVLAAVESPAVDRPHVRPRRLAAAGAPETTF